MNTINNSNNMSFQASLKVSVPVKDKARLEAINKMFQDKTQNYLSDVLHISKNPDLDYGNTQIHHLSINKPRKYQFPAHIMPNFDEMMAKLNDAELVKKLVQLFKAMKTEQEYNKFEEKIAEGISSATRAIKQNIIYRDRYKRLGKDDYAQTYETLIENSKNRIQALKVEHKAEEAKVVKELEKITAGDEDLEHIPSIYVD